MASTYSPSLRLELIGDGDQSGTWGQTTNTNLGTLIEQGITGVQTITMVNANYTLSNFNGVSDEARNAVLVVGGTNSAIRQVICPLVNKTYVIYNNTSGGYAITIGGATGSTVSIPNGVTAQVYCDGVNFFSSQTGSAGNFTVNGNLAVGGTTALTGALSGSTATFSGAISSVSPTFTGTPLAPTAAPGTNTTQIATTAFTTAAITAATGSLGTMSTQNANAVAITGGSITGITDLAVADGGTGSSTLAANAVLLGNGTSALQTVAPGSSGNVLLSNGTTWQSTAITSAVPVIGQTWTSYGSGDRASGGTYTNTTGKTIQVFGNFGCNGGGGAEMYVDGNLIAKWSAQFNGCGGYSSPMGALVPPGSTYKVITTAGGGFISWWELR